MDCLFNLFLTLPLQDDIDAACRVEDSDFQPILKPYQLVGVNFLLLLHRKRIGGGIRPSLIVLWSVKCCMTHSFFKSNL